MFNQNPFLSLSSTHGSNTSLALTTSRTSASGLEESSLAAQRNQLAVSEIGPEAGQGGAVVLTEVEAKDIFARLDSNSDNKISMIEFVHGLRRNADLARRLGLPTEIHQEDESREIFQHAFGDMDMDLNKNISFVVQTVQQKKVDSVNHRR